MWLETGLCIHSIYNSESKCEEKKVVTGATTGLLKINRNSKLFRFLCKKIFGCALNRLKENHTTSNDDNKPKQ